MRPARATTPLAVLGGLLALYLLVPIGAFVVRIATSHDTGFATAGLWSAFAISMTTATISTGVIAVVGIPLAYLLARSRSRWSALLATLVQLPLAVPPVMAGILLVYLVGPYAPVGRIFDGRLTESMFGIVLAQTFVAAPFLVAIARAAFAGIDPALGDVAATLGRGVLTRFARVAVPAVRESLRAGLVLAWLRAFGEYGATVVLAYHPYSLPVFTYLQFSSTGLPDTQAPTALALLGALGVVALARLIPLERRARRALPAPVAPRPRAGAPLRFALGQRLGSFELELAYAASSPHLALLGPSGSGKSVTLRSLAGLYGPGVGAVFLGERALSEVPVEARRIGYLPQSLALFPHLRVAEQVTFGRDVDAGVAAHWLDRLGIAHLAARRPQDLSGGERQRVCLARALSREPDLLLLDEPFSALDAPVREELRLELRELQRESSIATVLVTHDPDEAAMLSADVVLVAHGRLLQAGPTATVLARPASAEAARLLGIANLGYGQLRDGACAVSGGPVFALASPPPAPEGAPLAFCVRPEQVRLDPDGPHRARVLDVIERAGATDLVLELGGGLHLRARTPETIEHAFGTELYCSIAPGALVAWPIEERSVPGRLRS